MKLYEFEGHRLFTKAGIESPFFVVVTKDDKLEDIKKRLKFPVVAKVQTLFGKRSKSGGVASFSTYKKLNEFCTKIFKEGFLNEEIVYIMLAQKIQIDKEYYLSITYDTSAKAPFLLFCNSGGVDIEEVKKNNSEALLRIEIDPFTGPAEKELNKIFSEDKSLLVDTTMRLWDVFSGNDCRLAEINPLAKVDNKLIAIDAKIILDDSGLVRHKELDVLPKGILSAVATKRELAAKEIDAVDYRGSAGSTFIELGGDIAILASGGGASLLVMDSLLNHGGKSANYTEYSGNPPAEKVEKLTKIALSAENLSGCLVCGAVANFTDIYETLLGFCRGLSAIKPKPKYPIVIRRGGPRQKEAYEMLEKFAKKEGFDIHLFGPETPISLATAKMVELSNLYKKNEGIQ